MKKYFLFISLFLTLFFVNILTAQDRIPSTDSTMTLKGIWANGPTYAVDVDNKTAVFCIGHYLKIVNISGSTPLELGKVSLSTSIKDICIEGNFVYVVNDTAGLRIIDMTDQTHPEEIGSCNVPNTTYRANGVCVRGNYAYVANGSGGLKIVNISAPANPVETGSLTIGSDQFYGIDVVGTVAYISDYLSGLYLIDISDPANPSQLAHLSTPGFAFDLDVEGDYAYIANGISGLRIVDISDPDSLEEVGIFDNSDNCWSVKISGHYAYCATRVTGLQIIDIADPTTPIEAGYFDTEGWSFDIAISGDTICVADEYQGLRMIDVTDPAATSEVAFFDPGDQALAVAIDAENDLAYVADGLGSFYILDITDMSQAIKIGTAEIGATRVTGIAIHGNNVCVVDEPNYLHIVNVSDPASPVISGVDTLSGTPNSVEVDGDRAYVTMGMAGLCIVDISNPLDPETLGTYNTGNWAYHVAISGNYAYVADNVDGLRIINISDPENPSEAGFIDTDGWARDVAVEGNYAYVADYGNGLLIYNISDTANIVEVGHYSNFNYAEQLDVLNGYAIVIFTDAFDYSRTAYDIDVTHPDNPQPAFTYKFWGMAAASDVKMFSNYAIVPMFADGVYLLQYGIPVEIKENEVPKTFMLAQNYPNPFNPSTRIEFDIPEATDVTLILYNMLGQKVSTLINEHKEAGHYGLEFNASSLSSGLYFYHLTAGEQSYTRKMCLVK